MVTPTCAAAVVSAVISAPTREYDSTPISCNLGRFVELCLSESLSLKYTRKEKLTVHRNTTVTHV